MQHEYWVRYFEKKDSAKIRLFCLPYAGGFAEFYLSWKRLLPSWIELCPLQLPGRSYCAHEECSKDINKLLEEIIEVIEQYVDRPFAIFGHSMGSILAYEAAIRLKIKPMALILSGGDAPNYWEKAKHLHLLSDEDLLLLMIGNGSYNKKMLTVEPKSEYACFLNTLRTDLILCSKYRFKNEGFFAGATLVMYAVDDQLCEYQNLEAWKDFCPKIKFIRYENGGHFFIKEFLPNVIDNIIKTLENVVKSA
ncbi:MAG: thioesterase domain-containing protein [Candidatus Babeliales bacterium]